MNVSRLFILAGMFLGNVIMAQTYVAKTESGQWKGAGYRILIPPKWQKKLVMYAHGYEFMGELPRLSADTEFASSMIPFLERGFAVAASDYSVQGFAMAQGIRETEELRTYFVGKYGLPDTTFIVGRSMGGGISLATIENYGQNYYGAMPLCPLSSRPYVQIRKEFDLYATFNGLFPGIVPSLVEIFNTSSRYPATPMVQMMQKLTAIRNAIVEKDSLLGIAFARKYDLKFDDLPFVLFFDEQVLRDIAVKAGGNPFDNTSTLYGGFPDNWVVNQKAERLSANVDGRTLFNPFDRTGNINKPVLLIHTVYDQLIPAQYAVVNYENMVQQQGKNDLFVVKYTNGQRHCDFSPEETGLAFDELRQWVNNGVKPRAGTLK